MTSLGKGLFNKIKRNNSLSYLKEEFELLFTHFPGACMLCDHDGVIIEKNPMVAQFISCDEESLNNHPCI
ncbi:MAG: hypothetical protein U5K84_03110 [Alkalibacterium sp.]|nr:hypothetical protein [Alkalibacterium sp.]